MDNTDIQNNAGSAASASSSSSAIHSDSIAAQTSANRPESVAAQTSAIYTDGASVQVSTNRPEGVAAKASANHPEGVAAQASAHTRQGVGKAQPSQKRPPIELYTDGASSGNPGPGGYGVVLKCAGRRMEMSGGYSLTTNNRMELMAVIRGLEAIRWQNAEVHVWSDSSYVVNAINKGWLSGWQQRGFAKVKNPDLWQRLVPLLASHRVAFHWIKGHAGHPENERCDRLAVAAGAGASAEGKVLPPDPGYEG